MQGEVIESKSTIVEEPVSQLGDSDDEKKDAKLSDQQSPGMKGKQSPLSQTTAKASKGKWKPGQPYKEMSKEDIDSLPPDVAAKYDKVKKEYELKKAKDKKAKADEERKRKEEEEERQRLMREE